MQISGRKFSNLVKTIQLRMSKVDKAHINAKYKI